MSNTAHPLAGQNMSGADMILQVLADEGVDTIFGYSGGAILPTYDAIFRFNDKQDSAAQEIKLVVPANEQGAGFMAAGYARASGRVGVFLVTSGPGATNCVTPIRDCMADSVPVVLICGQVPTTAMGTDAFQEAPVANIMGPCAKHVLLVTDPDKLEDTIRTAFSIARSGRPGPVVVDVPKDMQNWNGAFKGAGELPIPGYRQREKALQERVLEDANADAFLDILEDSEKPLLYVGGGAVHGDAAHAITAFAEKFNIPVVTTLMGIGGIDTTHQLSMRMLGMHGAAFANYAVDDCDFLIAIGARFDDRVAGDVPRFAPNAKNIAHIDLDASEIGKVKAVTWSFVGRIREALSKLRDTAQQRGFNKSFEAWVDHCDQLRQTHAMNYDRNSDLIQPYYVIEELNKLTGGNAIVATGVGQHQMWAAQYFDFKKPRLWLTSGSMGTMGFGLPAAIGAQIACPDAIVIDVDGDGSIRMNIGELETATTYGAPIKVLLLNNLGDGMVRQWQKLYFDDRFSGTDKALHKKDFVLSAQSDGYEFAKRVSSNDEVAAVLKEFVEFKGPAFLEVMIDQNACVYPMVGPGQSYKQMVTGDHIVARSGDVGLSKADPADMF